MHAGREPLPAEGSGESGSAEPVSGGGIDFANAPDLVGAEEPLDPLAGDPDSVAPITVEHQSLGQRDRSDLPLEGTTGLEDDPVPPPDHNQVACSFNHSDSPHKNNDSFSKRLCFLVRFCPFAESGKHEHRRRA